jgi:hypothetical protein
MGSESIQFPDEKIAKVVALIRRGLKTEKDRDVKRNLERQCKELEEYLARMNEPDDENEE